RGASVSCTTSCGTTGTGVCTTSCAIPTGASCTPPAETCNLCDDNCDGTIDNGFTYSALATQVRITNDASTSRTPSLVYSGTEFGIAWRDARDGNNEIYFTRVDTANAKI